MQTLHTQSQSADFYQMPLPGQKNVLELFITCRKCLCSPASRSSLFSRNQSQPTFPILPQLLSQMLYSSQTGLLLGFYLLNFPISPAFSGSFPFLSIHINSTQPSRPGSIPISSLKSVLITLPHCAASLSLNNVYYHSWTLSPCLHQYYERPFYLFYLFGACNTL